MQKDSEAAQKRSSAVTFVPTMALAIFAAAGLSFGAAKVLRDFTADSGIRLSSTPITWWTSTRFGVSQLDEKSAPQIAEAVIKEFPPLVIPKFKHAHHARHHVIAHHTAPQETTVEERKEVAVAVAVAVAVVAPMVSDKLPVAQSAPREVAVVDPAAVEEAERQKLQSIHRGFRAAFLVAVDSQARAMTTQVAQVEKPVVAPAPVAEVPQVQEVAEAAVPIPAPVHPIVKRKHKAVVRAPTPPVEETVVAEVAEEKAPEVPAVEKLEPVKTRNIAKISVPEKLTTQHPEDLLPEQDKMENLAANVVSQNEAMGPPVEQAIQETSHYNDEKPQTDQMTVEQPHPEYSPAAMLALATPEMNTQIPYGPAPMYDYPQPLPQPPAPAPVPAPIPAAPQLSELKYVEAFDWITTVSVTHSSIFSYEGSNTGLQGRWMNFSSPDHLPTLAWRYGAKASEKTTLIPLISHNSALILEKLAKVTIQPETGIVFGKIPAGTTIEFSGRSERAIYFDQNNNVVAADTIGFDRYFALINVAPGAHLLKSISVPSGPRGAVLIPVLENTATYADLTPRTINAISGRVVDGAATQLKGLTGIEVRVVGQPAATVFTDKAGNFQLQQVMGVADRPLYLETDGKTGYTHRYVVTPSSFGSVTLFRLAPEQIQGWVGQLEGGISPDSGLAMAALPGLVAANQGIPLFPQFRPVLTSPTLPPETYTLTTQSDHLAVNSSLEASSPRFIGVQLADGPILAKVADKDEKTVWSQLLVASPDVINLIAE